MKTFFLIIALVLSSSFIGYSQNVGDTIVIQSYNYNSTTRDTVIDFTALPNVSFEKVMMSYSIRCTDGLVSNGGNTNLGCGEWDYSCNTYIDDSVRIDSVRSQHTDLSISNFSGTTFNYTSQPTYDFYQYSQTAVTLNNIISENAFPILAGTTPTTQVLDGSNKSGKSQFIYTAAELATAGFTAGNIDALNLNALNGGDINFLRVNIKETALTALDNKSPETGGYTEVFFNNYTFATGANRIQFHTPFVWNGTDNIIIEFSFTNSVAGSDIQFEGTASSNLSLNANNGYNINLSGYPSIDVTTSNMNSSISDEMTISFWSFGDSDLLPVNTTILHATDVNNVRSLNLHLPWENSRVYFDCGNIGTSYDRIDKAATVSELEGQWNHWAMSKNATTGSMKLYLNGALWHSGTGKNNLMDIVEMVIGSTNSGSYNYPGQIDELRIWNKELTLTEISDWMNISLDPSHPQYANLLAYYAIDNGTGTNLSEDINVATSSLSTDYQWRHIRGNYLERFFQSTNARPSLSFLRGSYDITTSSVAVLDSVIKSPNTMTTYAIVSNAGTVMSDDIIETSSTQVWEAIDQNVYDATTGAILSTVPVTIENTAPTPTDLDYYQRSPSKLELMSFVTPYGINLDLGIEGKTWLFDVTDYLPVFYGKKNMSMTGGIWQEDMDIKFLFIVGTPAREVLDIRQVWKVASRNYTDINNDKYFAPVDYQLDPSGESFIVRSAITGHGQEGEFIPRNHSLNVAGGASEFTWQVWKECGDNPIYPQGGTWVYDRAGWCPGIQTDNQFSDITPYVTAGQVANIDYDVAVASGDSRYIVNHQLVTYGAINHALDVSIVEVREPSNRIEFARFNSICNEPKVVIKNTGSTTLTSTLITYWVNNSVTPETYTWTGSLEFGETETVTLPSNATLWASTTVSDNKFYVELSNPNGGLDEYSFNNNYTSAFEIPKVMPSTLVIYFKTNNFPNESNYQVTDETGTVIHSRGGMSANTEYRDTLYLAPGCYNYHVNDTDDDGLNWWANSDGAGYTSFYSPGLGFIQNFNADFGDNINMNFSVDLPLSYEELYGINQIELYPNPAKTQFVLEGKGLSSAEITVYDNTGKLIQVPNEKNGESIKFNTRSIDTGIYFIQINIDGKIETKKLVVE